MSNPTPIGIIGMGGFAGWNHEQVKKLEEDGHCKLICTCDPNPGAFAARIQEWDLSGRGVEVFGDYIEMLDACRDRLDVVTIPTPVPLHAQMHKAVVERGIAAYLEKPPTLDYAELDEMLAVEDRAVKATNVGFNYIVDKSRQALKRRMQSGEFGPIRKVCFCGLWPREVSYFARAAWAARLMMDGRLVLDSCMGNAMAHHVHNTLFWAGTEGLFSWGEVASVSAELYRAHAIEGADTVFAKATTTEGVCLQLVMSHACSGNHCNPEWIICDSATIHHTARDGYRIDWNDGRTETGEADKDVELYHNLLAYFSYVKGKTERPMTRLIDSQPFVHLNDLTYVAAGDIATVSSENLKRVPTPNQTSEYIEIDGIAAIVKSYLDTGSFPSEQGITWARPGGSAVASDMPRLREVVSSMAARLDSSIKAASHRP